MKRTVAILLLLVMFFNIGGYYLVFWGLRSHYSIALIKQLDQDQYSLSETIELKIPLSLPYPLQQNGYERINGEFDYKNQQYKLVKQKIESDTLYVVCIKDQKDQKLQHAMNDFTKVSHDLPSSSKQKSALISQLVKEYKTQVPVELIVENGGWCFTSYGFIHVDKLLSSDSPITSPPPKSFC